MPIVQKNVKKGDNSISMRVNDQLYSYFNFDKKVCVAKLYCTTDDGKVFIKTRKMLFRK
jgi:hypothetical protein